MEHTTFLHVQAPYSTGMMGASLTSTARIPVTKQEAGEYFVSTFSLASAGMLNKLLGH